MEEKKIIIDAIAEARKSKHWKRYALMARFRVWKEIIVYKIFGIDLTKP